MKYHSNFFIINFEQNKIQQNESSQIFQHTIF
jgi:hypothetical protein